MKQFFARRKPTARIHEASIKIAQALQEEGLFEEPRRKALAEKRSDFVKRVVYGTKKSQEIEFLFHNGAKLFIDTRKRGKEFVFAEITVRSNSSGPDYGNLNYRLNEIAMERSQNRS